MIVPAPVKLPSQGALCVSVNDNVCRETVPETVPLAPSLVVNVPETTASLCESVNVAVNWLAAKGPAAGFDVTVAFQVPVTVGGGPVTLSVLPPQATLPRIARKSVAARSIIRFDSFEA
jgi:hypothetical protein